MTVNVKKALAISQEDFVKFREFFYRKTGIQFEDSKRYFVDKRLIERIEATGAENFRDYFINLRFQSSSDELQQLVNVMTVNETYFFREEYQLKCLVNHMLEDVVRRKRDTSPIRIWSMPSSSGEEPYSIAMYLLENWKGINEWDVELIASDIDTAILDRARRGIYSPRSVHNLPSALLEKHFRPLASGDYQISDELRQSVEFSRVNLMSATDVRQYRGFDVIFCRNLLIYFDDLSRRQAADTFFDALNPGGMICLGHSESMSRISSLFVVRKFPDAIVYQKPLEGR
ncbi:protein-glutamate O-methyltransferase CheR [Halomonas sp. McH1-25]|uniref:CheR family methyltransferase n=1 Tax=unclassified Halomonas TaxID=2609666 RepID=UPI001EF49AB7|nr:protein-glutamate O-methyltransferase CheR [Halomonas sp. McH1-25]MCP1342979.1 protein-glutamate O-methyltransferase CheR [Halomonas sp. FL8]MCP1360831.1 protein-glutamate O-methyltransferase CheR [Halomonas sp. BBD45]MCP1364429.1 protein-glutamate O-methyltransferase CheR [Halomonas sp. BBD48]